MDENVNFTDVYRQEADELLVEIEEAVLEIEENPEEKEAINRLFRAVHTIKGSGAMFGLKRLSILHIPLRRCLTGSEMVSYLLLRN
jgi:two-component system chemotaxis sensor kinase CheA